MTGYASAVIGAAARRRVADSGIPRETWLAFGGLAVAVLLWGTLHPVAKIALREMQPAQFTFLRALLAGVCLLTLSLAGRRAALRRELARPWAAAILGLAGFAASNHLSMASLEYLPAGTNAVLAGTAPLFAVLGAPLLGERGGWLAAAGAVVGFVGVVMLGGGGEGMGDQTIGVLLALGGAAAWAVYTLLGRHLAAGRDPIVLTGLAAVAGSLVLGILADPVGTLQALARAHLEIQLAVVWCGVAGTGATYALWASALRHLPATRVAPVQYLNPPTGLVFAWLLLGEEPGPGVLVGCALILLGVALTQYRRRRAARHF